MASNDQPPVKAPPMTQVPKTTSMITPLSSLTMLTVGTYCKIFMKVCNKTEVTGLENLYAAIKQAKKENRGLVTLSNHTCRLDDPLLWGATQKLRHFAQPSKMRWTIGAHDVCFKSKVHNFFFKLAQTLPIERFGAGPDQPGMDVAIELLNEVKWIHIYPEGYVHQALDEHEGTMRYFKWGISRLVLEPEKVPIVVPIYTKGLQQIMPEIPVKKEKNQDKNQDKDGKSKSKKWYKRDRKVYKVHFGEPIKDELHEFKSKENRNSPENRSEVAKYLNKKMLELKSKHFGVKPYEYELIDNVFWETNDIPILGPTVEEKRQKAILLNNNPNLTAAAVDKKDATH